MVQYQVTSCAMTTQELGSYTAYAIEAWCRKSERVECALILKDLSTSRGIVENAAALLSRNEVSMVHFWDVIEDFLAAVS